MKNGNIKVLLVDDSPLVLALLIRILSLPGSGIDVVGTAADGVEALQKIPKLDPQVVCTDILMPRMDGLELIRNIMATYPRPVLVLSVVAEQKEGDNHSLELLEAGAIDVMPKPQDSLYGNLPEVGKDLIAKIRLLSGVKTFTRHSRSTSKESTPSVIPQSTLRKKNLSVFIPPYTQVFAIGASIGGPHGLYTILSNLPSQLSVPVICFQHISKGFTQNLVDWLNIDSSLPVRIAQEGERLAPGIVYFPADNKHLVLDTKGRATTATGGSGMLSHRPSITLGFNSIAQYYGRSAVGILLTGMGADGADGLLNIRKAGGVTIAEDESSCVVFGMPKVAADIGAAQHVLSLSQIAKLLENI